MLTLLPRDARGLNRLEAWVTDAQGMPIAAMSAGARLASPEAGIEPSHWPAVMPHPGVYVAEGLALPRGGRWMLRLDLLVDDFTSALRELITVP